MSSTADATRTPAAQSLTDPAYQAFVVLRTGFTVAPILFGADKFANLMVDWTAYLWTGFDRVFPGTAAAAMMAVGAIEILAGILVALRPRIGAYVVAAWLGLIIVNLLLVGGYLDIALRDFGLLLGALALGRLAAAHAAR